VASRRGGCSIRLVRRPPWRTAGGLSRGAPLHIRRGGSVRPPAGRSTSRYRPAAGPPLPIQGGLAGDKPCHQVLRGDGLGAAVRGAPCPVLMGRVQEDGWRGLLPRAPPHLRYADRFDLGALDCTLPGGRDDIGVGTLKINVHPRNMIDIYPRDRPPGEGRTGTHKGRAPALTAKG
jgi:hypothetical protein